MDPRVGFVVDRLHVGTPDKQVRAEIRRRLNPDLDAKERKRVVEYAVRRHHANQRLYRRVQSGRF